jgi:outer membrane murein-binding lipoprotein Lpp
MSDRDRLDRLSQVPDQLEQTLVQGEQTFGQRARGAATLITVIVALMAALALSNLYFINDLTQKVRGVIGGMDDMTGHVDRVAARMQAMRAQVARMELDVRLMLVLQAQMAEMAGQVETMTDAVDAMEQTTTRLDARLGRMKLTIGDMAGRFRGLNQSVGAMGIDVNRMSQPIP